MTTDTAQATFITDRLLSTLGVALNILQDSIAKITELGIPPQDSDEFIEILQRKTDLEHAIKVFTDSHSSSNMGINSLQEEELGERS